MTQSYQEKIDSLPPLREIIATHNLRAEKSLGQNFLLDLNVTDKIAALAGDITAHHVFEIGPGPGGLTRSLLKAGAKHVTAIDFDPRAVTAQETLIQAADGRLDVMHGDALETDLCVLASAPRGIVSNLPYNIATPLLVGWLKQIAMDTDAYDFMVLMFQKEVAERIVAVPGTKAYGRLSVMAQWLCHVGLEYTLPPSAFTPAPKVHSSVVVFRPKPHAADMPDFRSMEQVTAQAFGQRRKMIRASLKPYMPQIEACGLDPTLRAENLSINDYVALAKVC